MKSTKIFLLALMFLFLFSSAYAFFFYNVSEGCAQNLWERQDSMDSIGRAFGESSDTPRDIREIVVLIIKVFLTLVGIILLTIIIYAGFKWMTAAGNSERVSQAKSQLINAIIGVIIILASYAITDFLADCVFDITTTGSTVWLCR